ncbi:MAG: tetratricopeptide repeat protein [Caldilineaceae bacterium]|nr:tetratricopeptide repeat protein [Caldilineaceae bacterium]
MNYQITRTKIILPRRRSDLLSRLRLLNLLEDLLDFRLVILIAPAGYGKTFLLVDFAHHIEWPTCWYALDALDRDAYRFYRYFIAAIQQQFPAFGNASLAALESMAIGQGTLDQLVATVVNELYDHVQEHFVLVLDDFYLVDENPEINLFISQFIQQVDENCHLIIASRRLLSLPDMALMVARGYVGGLDFEDLAFEVDELQKLSNQNYGQAISAAEAKTLIEATDGWIIGLLLSTQSKLRSISGRMRLMRASGIDLYDYLAEQVLNQQPIFIQEFLLRTSLLEEFDATLCATILDETWLPPGSSWQDLIDEVLRRNLFVLPLGEEQAWLRYNYVFQEFLQRRIARQRPAEEKLILERLVQLYRAQAEWEKAHYVLKRLGNPADTIALIEDAGIPLLSAGRISLLKTWLAELSPESITAYPVLLIFQGFIKARQGEAREGLLLLDRAVAAEWPIQKQKDLAYGLTRRSNVHRFLGNYELSLHDAEAALALIQHFSGQNDELLNIMAMAYYSSGATLAHMGKAEEAIHCLEKALSIYQAQENTQQLALTYLELASIYGSMGRYQEALPLFDNILAVWRSQNNLAEQANVLNNLGYLHHLRGEYEEALAALKEAHECAQRSGYARMISYSLTSMGDLFADLGNGEAAQKLYQEAHLVAHRTTERFLLVYLPLALAKLAAWQEAWNTAFTNLDLAGTLVSDRKSKAEWSAYQFAMGFCYLLQQKPKEAIESLTEARRYFAEGSQPIEETNIYFLLAAAHQRLKQTAQAQLELKAGIELAFTLESRYPLMRVLQIVQPYWQDKKLQAVDQRVKQLLAEVTQFAETLPLLNRRLRPIAPAMLSTLLSKTPQLAIRTLGRAEVFIDGRLLTNSDWQTMVSRDLFLCLLAHPTGLSKEEIGLRFWPDASPSELKTRFKNAIYRLRNAVQEEVILFGNDLYTFDRKVDYTYDVDDFLLYITHGNGAVAPVARIDAYQTALTIYRGSYLPEIDASWTWAERERLGRIFIESALSLVQLYMEQKAYSNALEICQRILTEDPCQEDAYRLAMQVYGALGNRAAIARQFTQCEQSLLAEIGVPPSPQTIELYQTLMQER